MATKLHKATTRPAVRGGKGTYYPGRTKPLRGVALTPLAKGLERERATFASPCGKKGEVYKMERLGQPGAYRYALLNDRIMRHKCRDVGKKQDSDGRNLMLNGASVPLIDLSMGLAVFFKIQGRAGVRRFQITLVPASEHAALLAQMNPRVVMKTRR